MGAPPHSAGGPGFAGHARALIKSRSRAIFQVVGGIVFASALLFLVILPAIQRGGASELLIIAGIFATVLLAERWLRTR